MDRRRRSNPTHNLAAAARALHRYLSFAAACVLSVFVLEIDDGRLFGRAVTFLRESSKAALESCEASLS